MRFKSFIESLEPVQTIPPNTKYQSFFVKDPNNPQQVNSWQKNNTKQIYKFPINKEVFIHFTLTETISEILASGNINAPVYAISRTFGKWFPRVQYDHIIRKKQQKLMTPSDLSKPLKRAEYDKSGWSVPNFGELISAIMFQTTVIPYSATPEEVYWEVDKLPINVKGTLSSRQAITLLKNVPYKINDNDQVSYT
jgi:hypothetical protein